MPWTTGAAAEADAAISPGAAEANEAMIAIGAHAGAAAAGGADAAAEEGKATGIGSCCACGS